MGVFIGKKEGAWECRRIVQGLQSPSECPKVRIENQPLCNLSGDNVRTLVGIQTLSPVFFDGRSNAGWDLNLPLKWSLFFCESNFHTPYAIAHSSRGSSIDSSQRSNISWCSNVVLKYLFAFLLSYNTPCIIISAV